MGAGIVLANAWGFAHAAEYRFTARSPSVDRPIWESRSAFIDVSTAADEDIVLVLDNPTEEPHGFDMPQLELVSHERIITSAESNMPHDTILIYTGPLRVTVAPGSERRIRLSTRAFHTRRYVEERVVFFCPVHRDAKPGTVGVVKR
jgi:hypothetical protein